MKRFRKRICKSGVVGFVSRLRDSYKNFDEFSRYDNLYNLSGRLGYKTALNAWKYNPLVESSVIPSDFRKVKK